MAWHRVKIKNTTPFVVTVLSTLTYITSIIVLNAVISSDSYALSGTWSWDGNSIRASNLSANSTKLTSSQSGQGSILLTSNGGGRSFTANEVYPPGNSRCLMNLNLTLAQDKGDSGTVTATDASGGGCPEPAYLQAMINDINNKNISISGTIPAGYGTTDIAQSGGGNNGGANSIATQWAAGQDGGVTADNVASYSPEAIKDICSTQFLNGDGIKPPGWKMDQAAYDACVKNGQAAVDKTQAGENKPNCAVDGVGWIVCPVMTFIGKITDAAFTLIANNFLELETDLLTGARPIWDQFRNIANVMFVVAFIIIIYSQITGIGITNYGIKKLLPKLIIVAVLVNLSFIFCQIAVDLSNILGYGTNAFFQSSILTSPDETDTTNGWGPVIGGILAGGMAAALVALSFSFPALLASFLAIVLILFILVARKALIILLVIVAPLAFVAYLLPNTESWFKKWWKMFFSLLMLFPVIGIVFGASSLASEIISKADSGGDFLWKVVALAVQALPLFAVPTLLKGSLSAIGSIGTKIGNVAGGQMSSAKKGYSDRFGQSKAIIGQRATNAAMRVPGLNRVVTGKRRRDMKLAALQAEGDASWKGMEARESRLQGLYEDTKNANATTREHEVKQAKNYAKSVLNNDAASHAQKASAQSALDEMERKEASAYAYTLESYGGDDSGKEALKGIIKDRGRASAQRAAALEKLMKVGGPEDYEEFVHTFSKDSSVDSRIIRQKMAEGLGDSGMFKGSQIAQLASGQYEFGGVDEKGNKNAVDMSEMVADNVASGVITERNLVTKLAGDDIAYVSKSIEGNAAAEKVIRETAVKALANDTLNVDTRHTRKAIETLAGGPAQSSAQSSTIIIPNANNRPTAADLPNPNRPPSP